MRIKWTWKEGFRFALADEFILKNGGDFFYEMSAAEKFGSFFLKPIYKMLGKVSKYIRKPLAVCIFTLFAAFLSLLIFYNLPALLILGKLLPYRTARFLFFLYTESTFFCIGCRALGRFNNKILVDLWKKNALSSVFLK